MSEPVITINGRTLGEGQATAVRVAITSYHAELQDPDHLGTDRDARRLTHAYRDRLDEVLKIVLAPGKAAVPTEQHKQRVNRILTLAGLVPELASAKARELADGYAVTTLGADEAAVRLRRALDNREDKP